DAQELRLQLERQLADLVEEERAAVGGAEAPGALAGRARERALVVPEELALEQPLGDRGAVDDDEGLLAARAPAVDGVGEALFARAGLAEDEDRRAGDRDLARF